MSFRDQLAAYIREQAAPAHKYGHQPRLYALTLQIATLTTPAPTYDDDIVYAAAFLHDLGVFIGHRPQDPSALATWNHVEYTFEATLLRDADILEQLGAIGILRTSAKLGSDTRFHAFSDVLSSLRRAIITLPKQIHLEATRQLAEPRIAILQAFLDELDAEAGQHLD